jgi:hypothetical protein
MVHNFHECDPVRVKIFDKSHGFEQVPQLSNRWRNCSTILLFNELRSFYSQGKYYFFFRNRRIDPDEFLPFIVRCRTICR